MSKELPWSTIASQQGRSRACMPIFLPIRISNQQISWELNWRSSFGLFQLNIEQKMNFVPAPEYALAIIIVIVLGRFRASIAAYILMKCLFTIAVFMQTRMTKNIMKVARVLKPSAMNGRFGCTLQNIRVHSAVLFNAQVYRLAFKHFGIDSQLGCSMYHVRTQVVIVIGWSVVCIGVLHVSVCLFVYVSVGWLWAAHVILHSFLYIVIVFIHVTNAFV